MPSKSPTPTSTRRRGNADDMEVDGTTSNGNSRQSSVVAGDKGKGKDTTTQADEAEQDGEQEEGDEDDEEEEYEIEAILDHADGYFVKNEMAYLVSWVGYGEEENSWIREEGAENASEMLADYWRAKAPNKRVRKISKTADRVWKELEAQGKVVSGQPALPSSVVLTPVGQKVAATTTNNAGSSRKRNHDTAIAKPSKARLSSHTSALTSKANTNPLLDDSQNNSDNEDLSLLSPAEKEDRLRKRAKRKYERIADWENIVKSIDTVERTPEGRLIAFVTFDDNQRFAYDTAVVNYRCPQKIIALYESRLRFRAPIRGDVPENSVQQQQQQRTEEQSEEPTTTTTLPESVVQDALSGRTRSPSLPTVTGASSSTAQSDQQQEQEQEKEAVEVVEELVQPTTTDNDTSSSMQVDTQSTEPAAAAQVVAAEETTTTTDTPATAEAPAADDTSKPEGEPTTTTTTTVEEETAAVVS